MQSASALKHYPHGTVRRSLYPSPRYGNLSCFRKTRDPSIASQSQDDDVGRLRARPDEEGVEPQTRGSLPCPVIFICSAFCQMRRCYAVSASRSISSNSSSVKPDFARAARIDKRSLSSSCGRFA